MPMGNFLRHLHVFLFKQYQTDLKEQLSPFIPYPSSPFFSIALSPPTFIYLIHLFIVCPHPYNVNSPKAGTFNHFAYSCIPRDKNNNQHFIEDGKDRAGFNVQIDTVAMDEVIMAQVENMEGLTGDVVERVAARRDILRQEVLALEEKYAVKEEEAVIPDSDRESKKNR